MILGNSTRYSTQPPPAAEVAALSEQLFDAVEKVKNVNEPRLIEILGRKNPFERTFIIQNYREKYSRNLRDDLIERASGDFGELLGLVGTPLAEVEAEILHNAVNPGPKEEGVNEDNIIRVVVRRQNVEINAIRTAYYELYSQDLVAVMKERLSDEFRDFIVTSLEGVQEEVATAVQYDIDAEVKRLFKAGQGKRSGPVESEFISMLCMRPRNHLRTVFEAYKERNQKSLRQVIEDNFEGNIRDALVFSVRCIEEPLELVAEMYEESFESLKNNVKTPLNLTAVRYQTLSDDIKETYRKKYGKNLQESIREYTAAGDYQTLLLALINEAP